MAQRIGITVTGFPGSGSTTLSENITKRLGWPPHYYAGGIVRWITVLVGKIGLEEARKILTVAELMDALKTGRISPQPQIVKAYAAFPEEFDHLVDEAQTAFLESSDYGVHEGRVAWFFAKKLHQEGRAKDKALVHVCCVVDPSVAADRLLRRSENKGKSQDEVVQETDTRLLWERARYRKLYGIDDHLHPNNFDIVIDTTHATKEETCDRFFHEIERLSPLLLAEHLNRATTLIA